MTSKGGIIVVTRTEEDTIEFIDEVDGEEFEERFRKTVAEYPYPEFIVDVGSLFENPRLQFGEHKGSEIARHFDRRSWSEEDTSGFSSLWPGVAPPPPKGTAYDVESSAMDDAPVLDCLRRFGPELSIVGGELNSRVYTRQFKTELFENLDLYERIHRPQDLPFRTRIVCGPLVMVRDDYGGDRWNGTVLSELWAHPMVELFCSLHRQEDHFRIAHGEDHREWLCAVYAEKPHAPGDSGTRRAMPTLYDPVLVKEYVEQFERILDSDGVVTVENPRRSFVPLTEKEITRLVEIVERDGHRFNEVRRERLVGFIRENPSILETQDLDLGLPTD